MIKVKLMNWNKGRNNHTFRPLLIHHQQFNEIGIQFIDGGDSYDFLFVGMVDFLDKSISLSDSIKYGIDSINKLTGDYFLFDGSDSTSLMAAYEVFVESEAKYLFKSVITTQEQYRKPSAFNKWFFGSGSDLDLSYDIPDDVYDRIKLTGWNFGYYNPDYTNFMDVNPNKTIDVCSIYQGFHKENGDHHVRNDEYYTKHRTSAWDILRTSDNISYETDKRPYNEFIDVMKKSKATLSPYGMGEVCFRDFEIIQAGSVMIKPSMDLVLTEPNIYIPYETYIPCEIDWSDLIDKINYVKDNESKCKDIVQNSRELLKKKYTIENLLTYWHGMFSNMDTIILEEN